MSWYFSMSSMRYGQDEFGPYPNKTQALKGLQRVMDKAENLRDGVEREFTDPYKKVQDA